MEDEMLMRIGEIAAFFNVSVKALRIYEKIGLIKPVKVDENTGYRYYNADQVKQLDALLELRELGFSLSEIKELLERKMTKEQYMEVLIHKKLMWQDKIAQAQNTIDDIDGIIQKLEHSVPPVKLQELTDEERAHLLSKFACLETDLHDLHAHNILSEALWL